MVYCREILDKLYIIFFHPQFGDVASFTTKYVKVKSTGNEVYVDQLLKYMQYTLLMLKIKLKQILHQYEFKLTPFVV